MPDKNQLIQEKLSSKYFDEVWILNSHTTKKIIDDEITKGQNAYPSLVMRYQVA